MTRSPRWGYNFEMKKHYKGPKIEYIPTPLTPFQKVKRWNECQEIARLFYNSNLFDDELGKLYFFVKKQMESGNFKNETRNK